MKYDKNIGPFHSQKFLLLRKPMVRSYRDILFLKFIGIDDPCSPNSNVLKKIDVEGEDFYCEMSCLMKKIKLALHELRGFVSDKYADSMANTSGCITQ